MWEWIWVVFFLNFIVQFCSGRLENWAFLHIISPYISVKAFFHTCMYKHFYTCTFLFTMGFAHTLENSNFHFNNPRVLKTLEQCVFCKSNLENTWKRMNFVICSNLKLVSLYNWSNAPSVHLLCSFGIWSIKLFYMRQKVCFHMITIYHLYINYSWKL